MALHVACGRGWLEIVKALLSSERFTAVNDADGDPLSPFDADNTQMTALHVACRSGGAEVKIADSDCIGFELF